VIQISNPSGYNRGGRKKGQEEAGGMEARPLREKGGGKKRGRSSTFFPFSFYGRKRKKKKRTPG